MTLRIYNGEYIGTGNIYITLDEGDNVYVSERGLVTCDFGTVFLGAASNHSVTIEGTVAADLYGVHLGDASSSSTGETIVIGEQGSIYSSYYAAVIYATGSLFENNGTVTAASALYIDSIHADGVSTIVNNGLIDTWASAIDGSGLQDLDITNNGIIRTGKPIFSYSAPYGDVTFENNGKIAGSISFGGVALGGDVYDGTFGRISGRVSGGLGNDTLIGGKAMDRFEGDGGRDILRGGGGGDHFIFALGSDSTIGAAGRDLILDFSRKQRDILDLSEIDAREGTGADDKFRFIGDESFSSRAGELSYRFKNGNTLLEGNMDGEGPADFAIELEGRIKFTVQDFIL